MATHKKAIIGGPSREVLFDSLRLQEEKRTVSFTVAGNGFPSKYLVLAIEAVAGGDGENWTVTLLDAIFPTYRYQAVYNTALREGDMEGYKKI